MLKTGSRGDRLWGTLYAGVEDKHLFPFPRCIFFRESHSSHFQFCFSQACRKNKQRLRSMYV